MLSRSTAPRRLSAAVTAGALSAVVLSTLIGPAAHAVPVPAPAVVPAAAAVALPAILPALVPAAPAPASYTVKSGDTLSAIASAHGVSLASVFAANNMGMTTIIYPGQSIKLDAATPAPAPAPAAPAGSYTVRSGDTLSAIAAAHGVSLASVLAANNLEMRSTIYPGQPIKLGASTPAAPAPAPTPAPAPAPTAGSYVVKAGDTLSRIASLHGVPLASVLAANNMGMTTIIYPGQTIKISGGITPSPSTPSPSTPSPSTPSPAPVSASTAALKQLVADTARSMGVDVSLALAIAEQESGFRQHVVSSAGAIGTMQVMPNSGKWASDLVGRSLNLNVAADNVTAGVAIIRALVKTSPSLEVAIASYYQGQYSVLNRGMYNDTKVYVAQVLKRQQSFR